MILSIDAHYSLASCAYLEQLLDLAPVGAADWTLPHPLLHPAEDGLDTLVHKILAQFVSPAAKVLRQFPRIDDNKESTLDNKREENIKLFWFKKI